MVAAKKEMSKSITETKEYQTCENFFESKEFERLTTGENAVFKEFDRNSADDLRQLRDYLSIESGKVFAQDYKSPAFTCFQIGAALESREQHREHMKQQEKADRSLHKSPIATRNPYAPLSRVNTSSAEFRKKLYSR